MKNDMTKLRLYFLTGLILLFKWQVCAQDTIAFQGFEETRFNTLEYITYPVPYNIDDDIWDTLSLLGTITPANGELFWGMQDLNNNNGGGNFNHTIDTDTIQIQDVCNVTISIQYNAISFDSGDVLSLKVIQNGVISDPIEIHNGVTGGASTDGWETKTIQINDTVESISLQLIAKQNGGTDQAGWDNILITGFPLGQMPLQANFSASSTETFCNQPINFYDLTSGGTLPYSYKWDFNDDGIIEDTIINPVYTYLEIGNYSVTLIVCDSLGTQDTIRKQNYINITPYPSGWINEFHYDDNTKDSNEGVEVVVNNMEYYAPANFTISLYNGNSGDPYNSQSLDQFIPGDTINGLSIWYYIFASLQNGSPDGISLDYNGILLDFISYEGTILATSGPAIGIESLDVGVQESSATSPESSIQLAGSGEQCNHFYWHESQPMTFGLENIGQNLNPPIESIWTGMASGCWEDATNWSMGLPGPATNVILPTGFSNYPQVSCKAYCNNISLQDGTYLLDSTQTLIITGNTIIEKMLTGGTFQDDPENAIYHYITVPLTTLLTADVFPSGAFVRRYDEPSQSWINLQDSDTLMPLTGYSVYLPAGNELITLSGTKINNDTTLQNLSINGNIESYSGFHLMGNPFTSPIDWDLFSMENIGGTVYTWYNGDYLEWNGAVGGLENGIIPICQGFFVQALDASNHITIPLTAQVPECIPLYKKEENGVLEISFLFENSEDQCFFSFSDNASTDFDPQTDALKLPGQQHVPQIYIIENEINYAICYTPFSPLSAYEIGLQIPIDGEYDILFSGSEFISEYPIYIEDLITGEQYDLTKTQNITFYATPQEDPIRFVMRNGTTGIGSDYVKEIHVAYIHNKLIINTPSSFHFELYNMHGQNLYQGYAQSQTSSHAVFLPDGVYILRSVSKGDPYTKKIIIRR